MNLTKLVLKRPVSAIVIVFGIIVFGIMSMFTLPQELIPEMEMPMLLVFTTYPGAAPEDVEKLVTKEVEGAAGSLSGIKTVSSRSMENISLAVLEYNYGTNMDIAYTDLKDQLDLIINSLPDEASRPLVIEMNMNSMPAMQISISSDVSQNLLYYVEDQVVPEFEKVASVADVSVYGGREDYIRVELLEDRMQQYGISLDTIVSCVKTADFSIPSGNADHGDQNLAIRSSAEYRTLDALRNIPVPMGGGDLIRLSDLANIYDAEKDAESLSRYNGSENVSLNIQKRQSVSAVTMSNEVMDVIEELRVTEPDLNIDIIEDSSDMIKSSLSSVQSTLLLSIIISMAVLFFFLGDIKASLIVGSSMPISLLITFTLMSMMGYTMNIVTMSGLVLGVGMMVDNSIVVLDSCFKSHSNSKSFYESALEGTKFVTLSIIASTLTTVVVFFPLATVEGMSGQLFGPLGFTIIFSLTASLISAMTLVPLFFFKFQPREKERAPAARMLKIMERGYGNLLRKVLNRKALVVIVSIALFAGSIGIAMLIDAELMPSTDEGTISISMSARPGLKLERADALMVSLEEMVADHPDVDRYSVTSGGSGMMSIMTGSSEAGSMYAYLKKDRNMTTSEIIEQWQRETANLLDCDVTISQVSTTSMMGASNDVQINIKGPDFDVLREFSKDIEEVLQADPSIVSVTSTVQDGDPQAEIIVDPARAAAAGFTPIQVAMYVRTALEGEDTVSIRREDQTYDIRVEYPADRYKTVSDLTGITLISPMGTSVPLMDIASIEFSESPRAITRDDNQYIVTVSGSPSLNASSKLSEELTSKVAALEFPDKVELMNSDMQEQMQEEFTSLAIAIATAVLLVFMVMAIQFESIKHSLMVMICIPFSLIGSFLLLFLTGNTINMTSLLGFLVLVGTVVNNGILFVDSTNQYRRSMSLETALVSTGRNRLRPILMTTLTTVLSMIPMALGIGEGSEIMQGLGVVVIGGLTASTILTLLLLPTFYLIFDGNPDKREKRKEKRRMKEEQKNPVTS